MRLGGSFAQHTSGGNGTEFGNAFVLGQYTVNPRPPSRRNSSTLANMQRYQQSFNFGTRHLRTGQKICACSPRIVSARGD